MLRAMLKHGEGVLERGLACLEMVLYKLVDCTLSLEILNKVMQPYDRNHKLVSQVYYLNKTHGQHRILRQGWVYRII